MRRLRKTTWTAPVLVAAFSCACGGSAVSSGSRVQNSSKDAITRLQSRIEKQEKTIAELEVRTALLESAAAEVRFLVGEARPKRGQKTIRIGAHKKGQPNERRRSDPEDDPGDDGPRPVIRLYGEGTQRQPSGPIVLPAAPSGVPDRLPVAPLPANGSARAQGAPPANGALHASETAIITEYKNALSMVRKGEFDQALEAFSAFIASYPGHAYTDNALYWRGEVLYAKREYQQALRQFQDVTERFPASRKFADSLLKIGMCHQRLGDTERARIYFRRVLRQFPDSSAARAASREDAS